MFIHKTAQYSIYFGDARDAINKQEHCKPSSQPILTQEPFKRIGTMLNLTSLAFLNQVHGAAGMIVDNKVPAFDCDGDFLITHKKNIGIGIIAADCLPIVFYDSQQHIAAIAHAGWRGSVAGIVNEVLATLTGKYQTNVNNLQIFFGPCAKLCCYQVEESFYSQIPIAARQTIITRDNNFYFDLAEFNYLELEKCGIARKHVNYEANACTICNNQFFSHRAQQANAGRQMNIICLQ